MPYNLISYLIYGILTYFITVRVGWIFYRNGYYYIQAELQDEQLATSTNNLLLACYYLTNLGYITLMIWYWERIASFQSMVEHLSEKVAFILLLLGILHFLNMLVIYLISRKNIFNH
jgi:hypothetical protein